MEHRAFIKIENEPVEVPWKGEMGGIKYFEPSKTHCLTFECTFSDNESLKIAIRNLRELADKLENQISIG